MKEKRKLKKIKPETIFRLGIQGGKKTSGNQISISKFMIALKGEPCSSPIFKTTFLIDERHEMDDHVQKWTKDRACGRSTREGD